MLDRLLAPVNRWALDNVDQLWVDYVVNNTMTDFNRWLNGFVWTYELKAQVLQVVQEAPGVKTFILRPNQHWRGMRAGQFVELILSIDGQELRRHYSATPLPKGRVSITVKATPNGLVSNWMNSHLRAGMQLRLGRPQGRFCLDDERATTGTGADAATLTPIPTPTPAKLLFLCAGSGITPCHAMVEDLLRRPQGERPDVQVLAQFRREEDVIFKQALRERWPEAGMKVGIALSQERAPDAGASGATRLDMPQLRVNCPDLHEREIFLCGPAGFMAAMLDALQALGVDPARVHTERFTTAQAFEPGTGEDFAVEGAEVYFQHLDQTIVLTAKDQGKTLLQVAQARGIDLESGCCQGMCGTCRLTLHQGDASGNVLGKVVYLCTAYPASKRVVLDA